MTKPKEKQTVSTEKAKDQVVNVNAPPVAPPTVGISEGAVGIPLAAIHVDWNNNISRQFVDAEHLAAALKAMPEEEDFKNLMRTLKEQGQINPCIVSEGGEGTSPTVPYVLRVGFRRHLALSTMGETQALCRIVRGDVRHYEDLNLIENVERKSVSRFQIASAAYQSSRKYKEKSEDIGKRWGFSAAYIRGLVNVREKLNAEILRAWADRDEERYPAEFKATNWPNLLEWYPLPAEEQVRRFRKEVLLGTGKTEEEADKILAEGGYKPPERTPRATGKKGGALVNVKVKSIKAIISNMKKRQAEAPPTDRPLFASAIAALEAVCHRKVEGFKVGKVELWTPPAPKARAGDVSDGAKK